MADSSFTESQLINRLIRCHHHPRLAELIIHMCDLCIYIFAAAPAFKGLFSLTLSPPPSPLLFSHPSLLVKMKHKLMYGWILIWDGHVIISLHFHSATAGVIIVICTRVIGNTRRQRSPIKVHSFLGQLPGFHSLPVDQDQLLCLITERFYCWYVKDKTIYSGRAGSALSTRFRDRVVTVEEGLGVVAFIKNKIRFIYLFLARQD